MGGQCFLIRIEIYLQTRLHYITEVINNSIVIVEAGINVAHPRYSCSELIELIEAFAMRPRNASRDY